jgi:hypothetical protein
VVETARLEGISYLVYDHHKETEDEYLAHFRLSHSLEVRRESGRRVATRQFEMY